MSEHHIRQELGKSVAEIQKNFFDNRDSEYKDSWYTGKVVDNNDPDRQGKCRIRVYGIFGDDIPSADLPWALPDFNFVGSTVGSFVVPPVNAIVKVYFDHGDIYLPHYTTKAVDTNHMPTQKDVDYPHNIVLLETDDGDYITFNRKSKVIKVYHHTGSQLVITKEGEAVLHSINTVRLDGATKVVLGDSDGYVVTAPSPGTFAMQNGTILTAQENVRA